MIISVLQSNQEYNSQLQINCINSLDKIFIQNQILNFKENSYFFVGVRGKYDGKTNYSICFEFNYFDYFIEFYIIYDQLEYYISKNGRLLKECNLEDFWEDKIMIEKFIAYLKKDLNKLKISIIGQIGV